MNNCKCDYNLLRKGLADEECPECYPAFVEKEQKYHKMLEGIRSLIVLSSTSNSKELVIPQSVLLEMFKEVLDE